MSTDIHRLLDEAFAGVAVTPAVADLKEEIRSNLIARVTEFVGAGMSVREADEQAVAELGDIHDLIAAEERPDSGPGSDPGAARPTVPPTQASAAQALRRVVDAAHLNRVRPSPGFVLRVLGCSVLIVAGVSLATLGATAVLTLSGAAGIVLLGVAAAGLGLLVGDALRQETTGNHPMPPLRASGYGLAAGLALYGAGFGGLVALRALPPWCLVFTALGLVAATALFALLAATQTNRHKSWTRTAGAGLPRDRFQDDPEAAARFGLYVAAIWIVAIAAAVVLGWVIAWWWAPIALVAGLAVTFLLLGRMLFPPRKQ